MKRRSHSTDEIADRSAVVPPPRRRRRLRWCLLIVLIAIAFHEPLLRSVGRAFTVNDPTGPWNAVVVLSGDHRIEMVKRLFETNQIDRVWMIDGRPDYLVRAGVVPSNVDVATEELIEAGVPSERMIRIESDNAVDPADFARCVKSRLQRQPETKVLVLCSSLDGRHVRMVFDDVLGEILASMVSIQGLPYDEYSVDEWWRSRSGLKQVFNQICAIGFTLAMGTESRPPSAETDAEAIEAALRQRFGSAACDAD